MKSTIKDVALKAGVGLSTVSRVINGNYPVSEDIKTKVMMAIKELGYSPNAVARSLKSRKTWIIGVIVADISNQFYMQLVKGIEDVVAKQNYSIIISSSDEDPKKENRIIHRFIDKCVDGLIVATCQSDGTSLIHVKESETPLVLVDRFIENVYSDAVLEDNESNSFEIVTHLIENGHRRIGIVNGNLAVSTARQRFQGYERAHAAYGIKIDERLIINAVKNSNGNKLMELLQTMPEGERPTAFFATNNTRCEYIIKTLIEMGLKVPDDVSLVSYGNISNPWMYGSKLTHIRQDVARMGKITGELMLEKLMNKNSMHTREHMISSVIEFGNSVKTLF